VSAPQNTRRGATRGREPNWARRRNRIGPRRPPDAADRRTARSEAGREAEGGEVTEARGRRGRSAADACRSRRVALLRERGVGRSFVDQIAEAWR